MIDMVVTGFAAVWLLLWGNSSFRALGATRVEESMKKISSRKTMSVMEAMLNAALILFLLLRAMGVI